jgi:hypothetical protein
MTDIELAAYLDRGLSAVDRERAEGHLAVCAECREQVLKSQEILEEVRRPRRLFIVSGLVAAAVAFFLIARPHAHPSLIGERALERGSISSQSLFSYGPTGEVRRASLRFVWGSAPAAASYRLTVTRTNGVGVWSLSSADTVASPPDSVSFAKGERYFWVADALLRDGSSRSTGLKEFSLVP